MTKPKKSDEDIIKDLKHKLALSEAKFDRERHSNDWLRGRVQALEERCDNVREGRSEAFYKISYSAANKDKSNTSPAIVMELAYSPTHAIKQLQRSLYHPHTLIVNDIKKME